MFHYELVRMNEESVRMREGMREGRRREKMEGRKEERKILPLTERSRAASQVRRLAQT